MRKQREADGRPCLTINRLPTFVRQVVNEARQNRPAIKVQGVDSQSDPATADIYAGLIRNIEYASDAEVAYDTAGECAIVSGRGYFRVDLEYAHEDTFDLDIKINAIANPFSVYADPYSIKHDSSDWNIAFVTEQLSKDSFERKYKNAEPVDWAGDEAYRLMKEPWASGEMVQVAEYWRRDEVEKTILLMPNGSVLDKAVYDKNAELFQTLGMIPTRERKAKSHKVTQYILSGAEVLDEVEWAGKYIPIVPVYGEEINDQGKRMWRGLVYRAMDAQRMLNYWRDLALDTPIPTPEGWKLFADIHEGDTVFNEQGKPCRVKGESPTYAHKDCYRITFDDGSTIVTSAEHTWTVEERGRRLASGTAWETKDISTEEMVPGKHYIWATKPLQIDSDDAALPISPYVLGAWLGNGRSTSGRIYHHCDDIAEVAAVVSNAGYDVGAIVNETDSKCSYFASERLSRELRASGLLQNKHVPSAYLRASESARWQLLQGLMDTDGSINSVGKACDFTTTSKPIAEGIQELLRTLGIKAKYCTRNRVMQYRGDERECAEVYQFYFTAYNTEPVFALRRKKALLPPAKHARRTKRYGIEKIERVDTVQTKCIMVDTPSHLFLAGEQMIPTHNTASTELVALAPRVPFVGKVGSFATDEDKWATINSQNHTHVEYDGDMPPTRQPLDSGSAIGAMQEALAAADDLKTITGIYDSALGQRSNETSGKAILARQRESDTGTFHFSDNLSRAIRHAGRICVDLIPHVYQAERAVRVLGEDKQQQVVQLAQRNDSGPLPDNTFDLSIGRYDVAVSVGPSFATRREEANVQLTEVIRAFPQSAPVLMDLMAKNWDWPGAEEAAKRLNALVPQQAMGEDPRLQQAQQAMSQMQQQAQQQIGDLQRQLQELTMQHKAMQSSNMVDAQKLELERQVEAVTARIKEQEIAIKQQEVQIKQFDSETKRLELLAAQEQARVAEMQAAMQAQQPMQPKHEMGMQHSMMGSQAKKPRMLRRGSATPQADGTVLINMAEEEIPLPPKTKRTNVQRLEDGRWLLESVEEGGPLETPVVKRGIAQKNGTGGWAVEHIEE